VLPLATLATGNVKSRKESKQDLPRETESNALGNDGTMRKVAQPLTVTSNGGNRRQRIVTPAAAKVIDEEDEPSISKTSRINSAKEEEMRLLGGIENV